MERENLAGDAKGKDTSGYNRKVESTDAPERGGLPRISDEASIQGKILRDNVGKLPWAAGTAYNLQTRLNAEAGESPTGVAHEPVGAMTEG